MLSGDWAFHYHIGMGTKQADVPCAVVHECVFYQSVQNSPSSTLPGQLSTGTQGKAQAENSTCIQAKLQLKKTE